MTSQSPEALEVIAAGEPKAAENKTGWRGLLQQHCPSFILGLLLLPQLDQGCPLQRDTKKSPISTPLWDVHCFTWWLCLLSAILNRHSTSEPLPWGSRLHTPQSRGLFWYLCEQPCMAIVQYRYDGGTGRQMDSTGQLRKDQNHPSILIWLLFVMVLFLWCSFTTCKSQYCWALCWHGSTLQNLSFRAFWETRNGCRKRTVFSRGNDNPQLPLNVVKESKYRALAMAIWNIRTGLMRGQKPSMHVRNKICPATEQFHRLNLFLRKLSFPQRETIIFLLFSLPFSFSFSPNRWLFCACVDHIPT